LQTMDRFSSCIASVYSTAMLLGAWRVHTICSNTSAPTAGSCNAKTHQRIP
ncbi:MAG: hypothetical protein ACI8ZW_002100, partial [Yoonia sp.]